MATHGLHQHLDPHHSRPRPTEDARKHVYIHVPFCDGECIYCALYSELYSPGDANRYLDCLEREITSFAWDESGLCPETLYVGGGTPTVLEEAQLERLCALLRSLCSGTLREWTIEVGPGTLTHRKARIMRDHGVTRVSVGAQSFNDDVLVGIGRRHKARDILDTVAILREAGFANIGLDLISGLPGMDQRLWRQSLQMVLELAPVHVSVYDLTVEPDSELGRMIRAGEISLPPEDEQIVAVRIASEILEEAGFERYELSNYARRVADSGRDIGSGAAEISWQCLHNVSFWRGGDYVGFGPSASSRVGRLRRTNNACLRDYITRLESGQECLNSCELLSEEMDLTERAAFALRLSEGVNMKSFSGADAMLVACWESVLGMLEKQELVERKGGRWYLTERGKNLADFVAGRLIDSLVEEAPVTTLYGSPHKKRTIC